MGIGVYQTPNSKLTKENMENMENNLNEIVEVGETINPLHELDEFFACTFELAKNTYDAVINSAFFETSIAVIKELDDSAEKLSKVYKGIKTVASIPDRLFLRKFERLCLGVGKIPENKRKKYIQKITREKFNKDSVFILDVINRVEDFEKIDIFSILWEAKMDEKIDDDKFRRYVVMTASTMLQDLKYMSNSITNDTFYISSMEQEGLVTQGWIIYVGLGIGTAEESGGNLYEYTKTAKEYCEYVWKKVPVDKKKNGPIMFTGESIDTETIEGLFAGREQ